MIVQSALELPKRKVDKWNTVKLGQIAELRGRIGWKGLTAKEYTERGPLFLSVHSLNYGDYVDFRDAFHISQERYDESPEIMLQKDDILICKDGAGIGKLGIVPEVTEPTTINSSLLLIRAGHRVEPKYLYYCLLSPYFQNIVQSRLEGATTPHLYQRDITEFPVELAPLEEQKRIVAKLDKAFAALDRARALAEANLADTEELGLSIANREILTAQSQLDWPTRALSDVVEILDRLRKPITKRDRKAGDVPYYGATGIVDWVEGFIFDEPLVLIGEDGAKWGAGELSAFEIEGRTWVNNHAHVLRPDRNIIRDSFLIATLNAMDLTPWVSGMTVPKLNQGNLKKIKVPVPTIEVQDRICMKLTKMSHGLKAISCNFEYEERGIADLRQSLLQKAFAGELT